MIAQRSRLSLCSPRSGRLDALDYVPENARHIEWLKHTHSLSSSHQGKDHGKATGQAHGQGKAQGQSLGPAEGSLIQTCSFLLVESRSGGESDSLIEVTIEASFSLTASGSMQQTSLAVRDVFRTPVPPGVPSSVPGGAGGSQGVGGGWGGAVLRLHRRPDAGFVAVHTADGRVLRYTPGSFCALALSLPSLFSGSWLFSWRLVFPAEVD